MMTKTWFPTAMASASRRAYVGFSYWTVAYRKPTFTFMSRDALADQTTTASFAPSAVLSKRFNRVRSPG
jgi:hypothetical protein